MKTKRCASGVGGGEMFYAKQVTQSHERWGHIESQAHGYFPPCPGALNGR